VSSNSFIFLHVVSIMVKHFLVSFICYFYDCMFCLFSNLRVVKWPLQLAKVLSWGNQIYCRLEL
jgi:hypothetical protein